MAQVAHECRISRGTRGVRALMAAYRLVHNRFAMCAVPKLAVIPHDRWAARISLGVDSVAAGELELG